MAKFSQPFTFECSMCGEATTVDLAESNLTPKDPEPENVIDLETLVLGQDRETDNTIGILCPECAVLGNKDETPPQHDITKDQGP